MNYLWNEDASACIEQGKWRHNWTVNRNRSKRAILICIFFIKLYEILVLQILTCSGWKYIWRQDQQSKVCIDSHSRGLVWFFQLHYYTYQACFLLSLVFYLINRLLYTIAKLPTTYPYAKSSAIRLVGL